MTLARALASLGTRSLLVERNPTTTRHPKMDITNGRSMELFRRLGVADRLRGVAVPEENHFDIAWITTLARNGHDLHRFRYPSVTQRARPESWPATTAPSRASRAMRVSQVVIEPVLQRGHRGPNRSSTCAGASPSRIPRRMQAGVTVTVRREEDRRYETVRCDFLAGCDGGGSRVRDALGHRARRSRRGGARASWSHFRSRARDVLQRFGVAWHYQTDVGTLIAQDDHDTWTLQSASRRRCRSGGRRSGRTAATLCGGATSRSRSWSRTRWTPHLLLAERYGDGPRRCSRATQRTSTSRPAATA